MSHDLNLDVILTRSEDTYSWIGELQGLPLQVREHFNYDVPALISAVKRLAKAEQERDETLASVQDSDAMNPACGYPLAHPPHPFTDLANDERAWDEDRSCLGVPGDHTQPMNSAATSAGSAS